jgi:outer membrane protein assembly factor BamB
VNQPKIANEEATKILPIGRPRRNRLASRLLPLLLVLALAAVACATVQNPDGWAPPTIVDGALYVTPDNGEIAAVDPSDLSDLSNLDPRVIPQWSFPATDEVICDNEAEPKKRDLRGIYGVPQINDTNIYFGAYDGNVYSLDREDGSCAWVFEADDPIIGGATLAGSKLYVGSDDSTLYVLDATDGAEVDSFVAGDSIWVTPLVTDEAVYVSTVGGDLYALDPATLDPIWDEPFSVDGALITDPVLADESTLLVGGLGETLYAVDVASGQKKWSFSGSNWFWARPLVADGTIYVADLDGNVYALDLDGQPLPGWSVFQAEHSIRSSPLLAGETLIIVDTKGNLYGVDPADGFGLWPAPAVLGKTIHSDPILFGDTVLAVARGGDLFQVDLESQGRGFLEIKVSR